MILETFSILLVEDEEAHAELTVRAIRKGGNANRIEVVCDGEQALDYLFNRKKYADKSAYPHPGLILLDIKLPGMDGIDLLKEIKEDPLLQSIPVIMLTTSEREEDIKGDIWVNICPSCGHDCPCGSHEKGTYGEGDNLN